MNPALWRIIFSYFILALTIYICEAISFWFYPLAVLIIGNTYYSLALLGHEAAHGLLHRNTKLNRFLGSYFCHFPVFVSHTQYTLNHLRHHRNLGKPEDPDIFIYQNSYRSLSHWLIVSIRNILNFSTIRNYTAYFNGVPQFLMGKYPFKMKTDIPALLTIWTILIATVLTANLVKEFVLYWMIPLTVLLPWFFAGNSYQHYTETGPVIGRTYTILFKNRWLQEFLFPLNINYHEIHHQCPDIPYYLLPKHYVETENSYSFAAFSKKIFNSQTSKNS